MRWDETKSYGGSSNKTIGLCTLLGVVKYVLYKEIYLKNCVIDRANRQPYINISLSTMVSGTSQADEMKGKTQCAENPSQNTTKINKITDF